jgi:hypothetical protein
MLTDLKMIQHSWPEVVAQLKIVDLKYCLSNQLEL